MEATLNMANLYLERIFMLEAAYNQERDRADRLERAIMQALDACPFCQVKRCRSEAHEWLRAALEGTRE